ncbi:MAG TPA: FmdE family protein [Pyrinomonadaceae bacterium]|jgi:formylmethanofuran dehydrogenase subunit E
MKTDYLANLDGLIDECGSLHGHICPGQVLGVRMALLGCQLTGIRDPRGAERKSLLVWVEIDRCVTDAISAVTGVRLGKRSLKFLDYGKVAATFLNLPEGRAFRIVAKDESRELADALHPANKDKKERQMSTYREADASLLFKVESVRPVLDDFEMPGRPRRRIICEMCGEGVNDGRDVSDALNRRVCRSCAFGGYYQQISHKGMGASDNQSTLPSFIKTF